MGLVRPRRSISRDVAPAVWGCTVCAHLMHLHRICAAASSGMPRTSVDSNTLAIVEMFESRQKASSTDGIPPETGTMHFGSGLTVVSLLLWWFLGAPGVSWSSPGGPLVALWLSSSLSSWSSWSSRSPLMFGDLRWKRPFEVPILRVLHLTQGVGMPSFSIGRL